jgi:aspartyl-tRNA(Asn)/glutamyl-tRNA(Gln) amidotransferase subunit A
MAAEAYALPVRSWTTTSCSDEAVRPRIRRRSTAREYLRCWKRDSQLEFAAITADIDALLAPVTTTAVIPIDTVDQSTPAAFTRCQYDLCALALPNGLTAFVPLSLQSVCRGGEEAMALRIGWALQNATEWHERVPPLS